ncbi:hypothetical protein AN958_09852 [Leucoagaricus sp. SymC.cos]|nr:hypothetical protein AN958_09852 [Leucoagaricus sp. SymC.cos]
MEDPWVNAWGDPQKSSQNDKKPLPAATWTTSSNFVTDDQADIAIPSWEAESGVIWDDSPDLHKDLWSGENRASQLWTVPTLESIDSIGFAKPPEEPPLVDQSCGPSRVPSPQHSEFPDPEANSGAKVSGTYNEVILSSRLSASDSELEPIEPNEQSRDSHEIQEEPLKHNSGEVPRVNSPDLEGFGTFEGATDDDSRSDPWASPQENRRIGDAVDWGETWSVPDNAADDDDAEPVDEWELAKRQKEKQDRYVPPEFLGSILNRFDEFSRDYWPGEASGHPEYQHNRNELADSLSITPIIDRLVPSDLTLPASTPFTSTFTSKEMIEALKQTRHHVITRSSPLAVYMNTKGSLSWEASVKSKPDVSEADVVPSGWRIVPKETTEQLQSANDNKRKPSGGLLSFFGRKSTTNAPPSGSSSPIRSNTPVTTSPRSSVADPRPSVDATLIGMGSSAKEADTGPCATMTALTEFSNAGKSSEKVLSPESEESVPAPSVVSRLFGRFSRSNRTSAPNSRNSIALSSDDLEFLSDIVPSVHDEMNEVDQLEALSTMIRVPPVPAKLPPPLAPPPRAPPLPKPLSSPPTVSALPSDPAVQALSKTSGPSSIATSFESQLFGIVPDFSSSQTHSRPPSQTWSGTLASTQASGPSILPPPLPLPLSPVLNSRSHTPAISAPGTTSTQTRSSSKSLFGEDDFSEFQTSPDISNSMEALDSTFGSFASSASLKPLQTTNQPTSFDDFDDFVSSPPQVPEKPDSIPLKPSSIPPPRQSVAPIPSVMSSSPTKLPSIHHRRLSKQADSDQRTLNLLETAAARGKWPAPPSPLPNVIPPPTNKNAEASLLNVFEESVKLAPDTGLLNTGSTSSSSLNARVISPPPLRAGSPLAEAAIKKNAAGTGGFGIRPGLGGTRSPPPAALAMPPPLIPPHPPAKPVMPQFQSQSQNSQSQQLWRIPSPPAAKPSPSFTQPSSLSLGSGGSSSVNGSRSGTPLQVNSQPQPAEDAFSLLISPASQPPGVVSSQISGSNGGKLSAQDLSFFEGL